MAPVNNGDIVFIKIVIVILGQETENIIGVRAHTAGGGTDQVTALTEAQAYVKALYDPLRTYTTGAASFTGIALYNRTQQQDIGEIGWDLTGSPTLGSVDCLPTGVAALVTFSTEQAKSRGRKFLAGMTKNALSNGHWSNPMLGAMVDYADRLMLRVTSTPISGVLWEYVIVSEGVGSFAALDPVAYTATNIPAYQRRRKEGVGI